MAIFDICQFLTAPGPFEYFSENGYFQKIKDISIMVRQVPAYSVLGYGRQVIGLQDRLIFFRAATHLMEWRRAVESQGSIFHTFEVCLRVPSIHLFHPSFSI